MLKKLTIATRGSKLALIQAETVKSMLSAQFPQLVCELNIITTSGDKLQDVSLKDIGGKELFTKEIDEALLDGKADIAVHSAKDIPGEIPDGLEIAAILEREDVRDSLLGAKSVSDLPKNAKIGTSSPRRKAQLLYLRPDLQIVEFRGNLPTRIEKLQHGDVDATILAVAGLKRMGLNEHINPVEISQMLPAAGQAAIAISCRSEDEEIANLLDSINHRPSFICVAAERLIISAFGGNCYSPLAANAELLDSGKILLRAFYASEDGKKSKQISEEIELANMREKAKEIAENLRDL